MFCKNLIVQHKCQRKASKHLLWAPLQWMNMWWRDGEDAQWRDGGESKLGLYTVENDGTGLSDGEEQAAMRRPCLCQCLWPKLPQKAKQMSMVWAATRAHVSEGCAAEGRHTNLSALHCCLRPWRHRGPCCSQGPCLGLWSGPMEARGLCWCHRPMLSKSQADVPGLNCHLWYYTDWPRPLPATRLLHLLRRVELTLMAVKATLRTWAWESWPCPSFAKGWHGQGNDAFLPASVLVATRRAGSEIMRGRACPAPSPAAALRRAGFVPHLDSTAELALLAKVPQVRWSNKDLPGLGLGSWEKGCLGEVKQMTQSH